MFFISFFVVVVLGAICAAAVLRQSQPGTARRSSSEVRTRPLFAANRTSRTIAAAAIAVLAATIGYLSIAGPSGASTTGNSVAPTAAASDSSAPSSVPSGGPSGSVGPISESATTSASTSVSAPVIVSTSVVPSGSVGDESTSAAPSSSDGSSVAGVSASATTATSSQGVDAVSATKPATGTDGLAATGVDVLGGAGTGALAVLLGTFILWTARRKGRHAR